MTVSSIMENTFLREYRAHQALEREAEWEIKSRLYLIGLKGELRAEYAFAIPDERSIRTLADLSPLVEIGAGNGYWASLLTSANADIIAFDIAPPATGRNEYFSEQRQYFDVWQGDANMAAVYPDRTLFLCWPPYNNSMSEDALQAYSGNTVAYIGEDRTGCTGNKRFHALLESDWEEVECHGIPRWDHIWDALYIYNRKK